MLAERLGAYTGALQARRYMEEHADDPTPAAAAGGRSEAPKQVDDSLFMAQMVAEGWLEYNQE